MCWGKWDMGWGVHRGKFVTGTLRYSCTGKEKRVSLFRCVVFRKWNSCNRAQDNWITGQLVTHCYVHWITVLIRGTGLEEIIRYAMVKWTQTGEMLLNSWRHIWNLETSSLKRYFFIPPHLELGFINFFSQNRKCAGFLTMVHTQISRRTGGHVQVGLRGGGGLGGTVG